MKSDQIYKKWEHLIAASRSEPIPALDIRKRVRQCLVERKSIETDSLLEYFGNLLLRNPFQMALLAAVIISTSGFISLKQATEQTEKDPVASFLLKSQTTTDHES